MILAEKGYYFTLKDLFSHYLASFSITYLAPLVIIGGEVFKGYVLNSRKENSTSLEKGLGASFIDGIFEHGSEWIIVALGLFSSFLLVKNPFSFEQLFVIFIVIFLIVGFSWYILFKKKSLIKLFFGVGEENQIRRIEKEILTFFRIKNKFFQKAIVLSFAKIIVRLFQCWVLVQFLGFHISIFTALFILGASTFFMAPPVSADIGTHDFGSAILFYELGMGQEVGLVFASIFRVLNLILSIFGIFFLIRFGFSFLKEKILGIIERISLLGFKK